MAQQQSTWSDQHDEALLALKALKVPEKEAKKLLEPLTRQAATGDLLRMALRSRAAGTKRPPTPAGGPTGAVPINPPAAAQSTAVVPASGPPPAPIKPKPGTPGKSNPWTFREIFGLPPKKPKPSPPSQQQQAVGSAPGVGAPGATAAPPHPMPAAQMPPVAPISPAAAQTQPAPAQKPRIRVRAAGQRMPVAPIGGAPKQPAETPPFIHSYEEYEQLAPGTEFIWTNSHVYRKPAQT